MWFLKNLCLAFRSWHLTHVTLSEWHPESTKVLLSETSHHEKLQTGRMECHHLHIMRVLDVGFQSDTSTKDGNKKLWKGWWKVIFCWTQMIPGHTVSRLEHKQLDRSFDQGLASMMKNCWQQLPPRCVFLCFFSLRWQLSFLRMLGVVEKMNKNSAISLNYWTLQWS